MGRGKGNLVGKGFEDCLLHLENLALGVGTIADVDEVPELGRVDLLVLGSKEKGGDANELQLGARHSLSVEVPVDDVHGQVEGLRHELEF